MPPRHLPGAAGSGRSSYWSQRIGKRMSSSSIGLLRVLAIRLSTESIASLPLRPAVRALVHLEVEPVLARALVEARVGAEVDPGRVAAGHLLRQRVGEREVDVVDDALRLAEAREAGAREVRVEDRPLRRDHLHRPEDAVVLRHVLGERHLVEQDRADGVVARDEQRALERDVVARRHLGVRAREVDRDLVALDDHPRLDPQADVRGCARRRRASRRSARTSPSGIFSISLRSIRSE